MVAELDKYDDPLTVDLINVIIKEFEREFQEHKQITQIEQKGG